MIKNEKQFLITKSRLERFQADYQREEQTVDDSPILKEMKLNSLLSLIDELQEEIKDYENLKSHELNFSIHSFDEIPTILIKARINAGLNQKLLAEKLGLKEQQVQRYEATNYASASLARILEVSKVLNLKLGELSQVNEIGETISSKNIVSQLEDLGLTKKFIFKKLIPISDLEAFSVEQTKEDSFETALLHSASVISRIFDWDSLVLFKKEPLKLDLTKVGSARFKSAVNAETMFLNAYAVYAHYLSLLILNALPDMKTKKIEQNSKKVRESIVKEYGKISFETILKFVWSLGIPVLPLKDEGAFKGASWRMNWKNIIVLKQGDNFHARWAYLLLHELFHILQDQDKADLSVIEEDELTSYRNYSDEEELANEFAADVLLGAEAEEIVDECVDESKGMVERLKITIPKVAKRRSVNVGNLADYMAFRLNMQKINWWGTATNLQEKGNPWEMARDYLMPNLSMDHINEIDRELLLKALT
jgi:transcriptional regulator with XRE-family HTH domain/Zn-dependent peptidase ImmA (M78 family)